MISSTGGIGAATYAVTSGALPAGLTLASDHRAPFQLTTDPNPDAGSGDAGSDVGSPDAGFDAALEAGTDAAPARRRRVNRGGCRNR